MSSSSDGRPPAPPQGRRGPPPPQSADSDTRANLRYPTPPRRPPPAQTSDPWNAPADESIYDAEPTPPTYAPLDDALDPRTGPATFDFQPSPLQPRRSTPAQSATPPRQASARTHDHGRVPQHPSELRDDADLDTFDRAPELRPEVRTSLSAPSRSSRSTREIANAPIVRADSVTGRSLTLVIAIMCFLACLTAGAVYMMNQSASAWLRDIAAEVTVQVEAREKIDVEAQVREVAAFLGKQSGIVSAKPLSLEVSAGLLEPWLGHSEGLKNLPVPRLIAVEVDRFNPPDFNALRKRLEQFKGTSLDDHRHWQQQIRTVTRSFALGGLAILILVGAATTAIIVSATRSAMAANREIVEVLHFVGATDRFIARQFQRHFLSLGIRAGIVGAVLAGLAFLGIPFAMELLGGGTASAAELQHLVGTGALDWQGYGWLCAVVVVIAGLCMFTSRIGVYRILHSQH